MRYLRKTIFLLSIILFLTLSSTSQDYYADINLEVDTTGFVSINGSTNHIALKPGVFNDFTNKKASMWLLNLSLDEKDIFTQQVWAVTLPENAQVNYVKSPTGFRISSNENKVKVSGFAENKTFSILIQYQIPNQNANPPTNPIKIYLIKILYLAAIITLIYTMIQKRRKNKEKSKDLQLLTDRQKQIIELLKKEKQPINQSLISERLDIPKSAVSRNLETLLKLNLITKTKVGMSTMVSLKK